MTRDDIIMILKMCGIGLITAICILSFNPTDTIVIIISLTVLISYPVGGWYLYKWIRYKDKIKY